MVAPAAADSLCISTVAASPTTDRFHLGFYLINGAPTPVFIDFPKLGFHCWQSSCHSFFYVFLFFFFSQIWTTAAPRWLNNLYSITVSRNSCRLVRRYAVILGRARRLPCYLSRPAASGNTPLTPPTHCSRRPPVATTKQFLKEIIIRSGCPSTFKRLYQSRICNFYCNK